MAVISNLYWLVSMLWTSLRIQKLWDLILPGDLKEWDTEDTLIYDLWEARFHHRQTIDHPERVQGDHTRVHNTCRVANITAGSSRGTYKGPWQLVQQPFTSYKSLFGLHQDILKILSSAGNTATYNCTPYALDDLHLEHTFNTLQSTTKLYKLQSVPIFNGSKATRTSIMPLKT